MHNLHSHRANKMRRDHGHTTANHGGGVYAQPKLPPEHYVGDFDEVQMGLPGSAPCGPRTCCCCLNAGEFETIRTREEPSRAPCCPSSRQRASSTKGGVGRVRMCAACSAMVKITMYCCLSSNAMWRGSVFVFVAFFQTSLINSSSDGVGRVKECVRHVLP